jgi:hypothetical protein
MGIQEKLCARPPQPSGATFRGNSTTAELKHRWVPKWVPTPPVSVSLMETRRETSRRPETRCGQRETASGYFASRGSGVRVPLAPPGQMSAHWMVEGPSVAAFSSNGSSACAVEQIMEPDQGFALGVLVSVGVDLQGDGQP